MDPKAAAAAAAANDPLKQARKDWHQKLFKNPAETVVALGEASGKKASAVWHRQLLLGVLAGFFIGLGGAVSLAVGGGVSVTTTKTDNVTGHVTNTSASYSFSILPKLALGSTFPVGLVLVVIVGAELFTGNAMIMALGLMAKKITWQGFLLNWGMSYLGNFIGATLMAGMMLGTQTYMKEPYRTFLFQLTNVKIYDNWGVLLLKGILCNVLVCVAITMAVASEDVISKIVAIYIAIFTFIVLGFEHSIANMFYLSTGIFYGAPAGYGDYLWRNLLPVTIGNIIGAVVILSLPYFYLYYVVLAPKVLKPASQLVRIRPDGSFSPIALRRDANGDIEMGALTSLLNANASPPPAKKASPVAPIPSKTPQEPKETKEAPKDQPRKRKEETKKEEPKKEEPKKTDKKKDSSSSSSSSSS